MEPGTWVQFRTDSLEGPTGVVVAPAGTVGVVSNVFMDETPLILLADSLVPNGFIRQLCFGVVRTSAASFGDVGYRVMVDVDHSGYSPS